LTIPKGAAPAVGDVCGDLLDIHTIHLACYRIHVYRDALIKPNFTLLEQRDNIKVLSCRYISRTPTISTSEWGGGCIEIRREGPIVKTAPFGT
jgi:hypothetical protein